MSNSEKINFLRTSLELNEPKFRRLRLNGLLDNIRFKYLSHNIIFVLKTLNHFNKTIEKFIKKIIYNKNTNFNNYYDNIEKNFNILKNSKHVCIHFLYEKDKFPEIKQLLTIVSIINNDYNRIFLNESNIIFNPYEDIFESSRIDDIKNTIRKIGYYLNMALQNLIDFKDIYLREIVKFDQPTLDEQNFCQNLYENLIHLNLFEVVSKFDQCKNEFINELTSKKITSFNKQLNEIFIDAQNNINSELYSNDVIDNLKNSFIIDCYRDVGKNMDEHFKSPMFIHKLNQAISKYNKELEKPIKIKKRTDFLIKKYPILKDLQLYYRKKNGTMKEIYLTRDLSKPLTINLINNGDCHRQRDHYNDKPGCIFRSGDGIDSHYYDRMFFYSSFKSIMFNYHKIPKNIFWKKSIHIPAASDFYVNMILTFKKSYSKGYIKSIPLELITMILGYIPLKYMCISHVYKNGELFN